MREAVERLWPEIQWIGGSKLREQVTQAWIKALERSPLKPEDLNHTVTIRQEPHTVVQALNRALAHYAQHTGQIVFLAKHLRSSQWRTLSIPKGKSEDYKAKGVSRGAQDSKL